MSTTFTAYIRSLCPAAMNKDARGPLQRVERGAAQEQLANSIVPALCDVAEAAEEFITNFEPADEYTRDKMLVLRDALAKLPRGQQ